MQEREDLMNDDIFKEPSPSPELPLEFTVRHVNEKLVENQMKSFNMMKNRQQHPWRFAPWVDICTTGKRSYKAVCFILQSCLFSLFVIS